MIKRLNIIIIVLMLIISVAAVAHTGIKSTSPENKSVLEEASKALTLSFRSMVRLMKVKLLGVNDEAVDLYFKPSAKPDKSIYLI